MAMAVFFFQVYCSTFAHALIASTDNSDPAITLAILLLIPHQINKSSLDYGSKCEYGHTSSFLLRMALKRVS